MSKENKTIVPVTQTIKAHFDTSGGVSNYGDKTQKIIEHFKLKATETLAKYGIALEWTDASDVMCELQMKLVEIDTGNKTVRFFVGCLPIISNFFGPAAKFEAEGEYAKNGKNVSLRCQNEYCASSFGTEWSMQVVSGKAAIRLAEDLLPLIKAEGSQS
jgi:hypothetical protein